MITTDDMLFSVLNACCDGLEVSRLTYYVYLYQISGLDYEFRYKLRASGVDSRNLDAYVNTLIANNMLKVNSSKLSLTSQGSLYYNEIILTYEEWEHFNKIKQILDNLTIEELYLTVISDMIITNELNRYGVDKLQSDRARITNSISNLSSIYTDKIFNDVLRLIRCIKEGFK